MSLTRRPPWPPLGLGEPEPLRGQWGGACLVGCVGTAGPKGRVSSWFSENNRRAGPENSPETALADPTEMEMRTGGGDSSGWLPASGTSASSLACPLFPKVPRSLRCLELKPQISGCPSHQPISFCRALCSCPVSRTLGGLLRKGLSRAAGSPSSPGDWVAAVREHLCP